MTLTVKDLSQMLIPPSVQRKAGFKMGDRLELRVSRGIITIAAKPESADDEYTPEQRRYVDAQLAEGLADVKAGRVHGPFASAKEASAYIEADVARTVKPKTSKRQVR